MFDIGASELLVIVIVAIIAIGPKDMPRALRAAGRWIGKMRRMSNHFRAGVDAMIREAEMEEMERSWADRNKEIMARYPDGEAGDEAIPEQTDDGDGLPAQPVPPAAAEAAIDPAPRRKRARAADAGEISKDQEPLLPIDPADKPGGAD